VTGPTARDRVNRAWPKRSASTPARIGSRSSSARPADTNSGDSARSAERVPAASSVPGTHPGLLAPHVFGRAGGRPPTSWPCQVKAPRPPGAATGPAKSVARGVGGRARAGTAGRVGNGVERHAFRARPAEPTIAWFTRTRPGGARFGRMLSFRMPSARLVPAGHTTPAGLRPGPGAGQCPSLGRGSRTSRQSGWHRSEPTTTRRRTSIDQAEGRVMGRTS
jgi:hypothetical protein